MLKKKVKKSVKMRGSNSHGYGHKKKHRGSGHRGGFGNAGTGARGDSKKPTILKQFGSSYFGKRGFSSVNKKVNNTISLAYIEHNFDKMIDMGMITKEGSEYVFDAGLYKIDKVLGNGSFSKKLTVICDSISEHAKTRIEDMGGKVVLADGFEESSE
jgi:large subunit ribosomal protein L15